MIELKSYGLQTHQGPHLNLNEDIVDLDLANNLFLLIDGFGGSNIGDRAAMIVRDNIKRAFTKIAIDPEATLPFYFSHKYLIEGNALINAFQSTHQSIVKDNESKSLENRGGASVLAGALSESILSIVSTGNCAAYLFRKGHLTLELIPDSLNNLTRDSYQPHLHSIPLSGIGLFEDLHYNVREIKIAKGDQVLFLTDGVYARLNHDEIKYIIEKNLDNELEILKDLFGLSNDRGNLDNQSGLVLTF